jgi:glycosyltransferase involved in cell wall biosynthesis
VFKQNGYSGNQPLSCGYADEVQLPFNKIMKVLFVIDSLGTGGAERSTAEFWHFLKQRNISFSVIALRKREEGIQQEILSAGMQVKILSGEGFFSNVLAIAKIIGKEKPDIVHSVLFKSNLRTRFAKLLTNSFIHIESLVNTTYAAERFLDKKVNSTALCFYKVLDAITAKLWVDAFIANTNEIKQHYIKHVGLRSDKMQVIYRGRQANKSLNNKEEIRTCLLNELGIISNDAKILINVGRQEYQKGQTYLLQAFAKLKIEYPDLILVIAGRKGAQTKALEKIYHDNQLEGSVYFVGHRTDINDLLVAADIFVFTSVYEGIGGALIEAMAAKLPIICSDLPGLREVLTKKEAIFIKPKSIDSIVDAVKEFLSNPQFMHETGKNSLDLFQSGFQIEHVNEAVLTYYQQMIERE